MTAKATLPDDTVAAIRSMIGDENPLTPVTDRQIAKLLGMSITSAIRWRERLRIPGPRLRHDDYVRDTILPLIRTTVANENPHRPLTDSNIAARLKVLGHNVTRHAVRKFRERISMRNYLQRAAAYDRAQLTRIK